MKRIEKREQQAVIGKDFRQWADDYFAIGSSNLDCELKSEDVVNAFNSETRYGWSPKKVTQQLKAYCSFADHISCMNPASITGKKTDGERWIKRENGRLVQFYYIQSSNNATTQQTDEEALPF